MSNIRYIYIYMNMQVFRNSVHASLYDESIWWMFVFAWAATARLPPKHNLALCCFLHLSMWEIAVRWETFSRLPLSHTSPHAHNSVSGRVHFFVGVGPLVVGSHSTERRSVPAASHHTKTRTHVHTQSFHCVYSDLYSLPKDREGQIERKREGRRKVDVNCS